LALVHKHEPDWSHDLALVGLALVLIAVIAISVPCLKFVVDMLFRLTQ
jgi:hypothetical protein